MCSSESPDGGSSLMWQPLLHPSPEQPAFLRFWSWASLVTYGHVSPNIVIQVAL